MSDKLLGCPVEPAFLIVRQNKRLVIMLDGNALRPFEPLPFDMHDALSVWVDYPSILLMLKQPTWAKVVWPEINRLDKRFCLAFSDNSEDNQNTVVLLVDYTHTSFWKSDTYATTASFILQPDPGANDIKIDRKFFSCFQPSVPSDWYNTTEYLGKNVEWAFPRYIKGVNGEELANYKLAQHVTPDDTRVYRIYTKQGIIVVTKLRFHEVIQHKDEDKFYPFIGPVREENQTTGPFLWDLQVSQVIGSTHQTDQKYLPADYRQLVINDAPVFPVAQGVRTPTMGNANTVYEVIRRMADHFSQNFYLEIAEAFTRSTVLNIGIFYSPTSRNMQMVIRIPRLVKLSYAVFTLDTDALWIKNISPLLGGGELPVSDYNNFSNIVVGEESISNAGMAAAVIGGNIIQGIGQGFVAGAEMYYKNKQWTEQLEWFKQSQQNQFEFQRQYQAAAYRNQIGLQRSKQELAGYRTEGAARGIAAPDRRGLGYTGMAQRMDYGNSMYGSPPPFIYGGMNKGSYDVASATKTYAQAVKQEPKESFKALPVDAPREAANNDNNININTNAVTTVADVHEPPHERTLTI